MGVDFEEVNTIVHYGAPVSIEDYSQESGRGGRNGASACSVIYWKPSECPVRREPSSSFHHEQIEVRKYLENDVLCRRKLLLQHFNYVDAATDKTGTSLCCDVCQKGKHAVQI